jgi:chromosome segregation ATPase
MTKDHLGILENHVQAIKEANNAKSSNEVLLETIKLLLDNLDYSGTALYDYDKIGIRKLFSGFGKIAQSTCDFYKKSKTYLDPVALDGEIGQALERTTNKLTDTIALIEKIDRDSAELLKKEHDLEKKESTYRNKEEKMASLREKSRLYTDETIKALDDTKKELEEEIKRNKPIKAELEDSIKENGELSAELASTIVRLNNEKNEIEENIIDIINKRREKIEEIFVSQSKDLNKIITEIENYKRQSVEMDKRIEEIKEPLETYRLHYGENSRIIKKINEYGISSLDDFIKDSHYLENAIREKLAEFDSRIRDIIEFQEKANEDIKGLQNK